MEYDIRLLQPHDHDAAAVIWNGVITEGTSFPAEEPLSLQAVKELFDSATAVRGVFEGDRLLAFYVLKPNSFGRCAHTANAGYAVAAGLRGKGFGRLLVADSLEQAAHYGFRGMQFNAVVATNYWAIRLYLSFGFRIIGTIPGGFRLPDNTDCDMLIFYRPVDPPL